MTPEGSENALFSHKAALFGLLANPDRIRILELLRDGDGRSVDLIRASLGADSGTIDDDVAKLYAEGLLESCPDGSAVLYRAKDPRIFQLLELASEVLTFRPAVPPEGEL